VTRASPLTHFCSPSAKMQEERILHEAKLSKMEAEMKMVFQQKVQEKESKLKQSEEELYARHKEMKDALDKQRGDLEDKKRRIESGRPLTPEKNAVSTCDFPLHPVVDCLCADQEPSLPPVREGDRVFGCRLVTVGWWSCASLSSSRPAPLLVYPFSSLASVHCRLCFPLVIILWNIFSTLV
jgi:hypothetical protein